MYKQTKQEIKALRERAEAVEKEEHRRLVDAAKKRAAAQNVDYPTFAAMVSVAHLQPVQRKRADEVQQARNRWTPRGWSLDEAVAAEDDRLSQSLANDPLTVKRRQAYERQATLKLLHTIENVAGDSKPREQQHSVLSSDMFIKEWRKLSDNLPLRMRLLRKLCPEDIPRIFKAELPSRLLTEMLETVRSWQLNGMTCVAAIQPPASAAEERDAAVSYSASSNLQDCSSAPNLTLPNNQEHVVPDAGSFSPELVRTLANMKLLNADYCANEGGDYQDALTTSCAQGTDLGEVEETDLGEASSQVDWVTSELASIAEGHQPTRKEKSERFKQLMRDKKMLWLLRFLHALTRCGRFDLALKMGKRGRATASSILDLLVADMPKEGDKQGGNDKRSYYECRPNFVMPPHINRDEEAPTELNLEQMKYLRAIYLH